MQIKPLFGVTIIYNIFIFSKFLKNFLIFKNFKFMLRSKAILVCLGFRMMCFLVKI